MKTLTLLRRLVAFRPTSTSGIQVVHRRRPRHRRPGADTEAGWRARCRAQGAQVTRPVQVVPSTTSPKAMRYQAKGTKLWVEM